MGRLHISNIVGTFAHPIESVNFCKECRGQNLRLTENERITTCAVGDHIPLKQGLRP